MRYLPEIQPLVLADHALLPELLPARLDLILPLLLGGLQLQLHLLQGEHAVGLVVQQIPHALHLHLHDVVLHHVVLLRNVCG